MEIWELVNAEGEPTGVLYERGSKKEIPEGLYFRVVEVWTRIGGKLLVTQRHPSKWMGLKWEVTGGGVVVGETLREAAVRELFEETGIKVGQNDIVELGIRKFGAAQVTSYLLKMSDASDFCFDPEEVVDHKLVTMSEFEGMIEQFNSGTCARFHEFKDRIFNCDEK